MQANIDATNKQAEKGKEASIYQRVLLTPRQLQLICIICLQLCFHIIPFTPAQISNVPISDLQQHQAIKTTAWILGYNPVSRLDHDLVFYSTQRGTWHARCTWSTALEAALFPFLDPLPPLLPPPALTAEPSCSAAACTSSSAADMAQPASAIHVNNDDLGKYH